MTNILLPALTLKTTYTFVDQNNCNKYIVQFNSQGGSLVTDTVVYYYELLTEPIIPVKNNYIFGGWYIESECTNPWNFGTDRIVTDITVYARWILPIGAKELKPLAGFRIYPNQAVRYLNITYQSIEKLEIFNTIGKCVMKKNMNGSDSVSLDLTVLGSGYYVIVIYSKSHKPVTYKFLKK